MKNCRFCSLNGAENEGNHVHTPTNTPTSKCPKEGQPHYGCGKCNVRPFLAPPPTPTTDSKNSSEDWEKEFIEQGAHLEHERWAKWQTYLHSKCVEHENGKGEWVCFPAERFKHWERQINTPYSELSENEKESDRAEVRQYLPLIQHIAKEEYERGGKDMLTYLAAGTITVKGETFTLKALLEAALETPS